MLHVQWRNHLVLPNFTWISCTMLYIETYIFKVGNEENTNVQHVRTHHIHTLIETMYAFIYTYKYIYIYTYAWHVVESVSTFNIIIFVHSHRLDAHQVYISLVGPTGCQPKNRGENPPKWMVKIMENPIFYKTAYPGSALKPSFLHNWSHTLAQPSCLHNYIQLLHSL